VAESATVKRVTDGSKSKLRLRRFGVVERKLDELAHESVSCHLDANTSLVDDLLGRATVRLADRAAVDGELAAPLSSRISSSTLAVSIAGQARIMFGHRDGVQRATIGSPARLRLVRLSALASNRVLIQAFIAPCLRDDCR
jgi:hypothetical protein